MSRTRKKPSALTSKKSSKNRITTKKHNTQLESDPSRIWTRPGFLIRRLHQIQCALFFEECHASTITPLQSGMLTVLTENPEGAGIRELAFQLGTDHSTTADVARRLARRGYIKQHIPKTDRRKIVSRITPEGRAFLKRNDTPMQRSQDILLQPLPPKQRIALMSALRTLVHHYNDKGRARLQL